MDIVISIALILVSITVVGLVGYVSRRILVRQEELAKQLQKMAGVQNIEQIGDETTFRSLAQILKANQPTKRLRILTLSGATSLLRNDGILLDILSRGVDVELMLLDPKVDNLFFNEYPRLLDDIKSNLEKLTKLGRDAKNHGRLSVRLFTQPVFHMLIFIDDNQLFISSFVPVDSSNRLIFEVRNGESSLYKLHEPVFEFLWSHAKTNSGQYFDL